MNHSAWPTPIPGLKPFAFLRKVDIISHPFKSPQYYKDFPSLNEATQCRSITKPTGGGSTVAYNATPFSKQRVITLDATEGHRLNSPLPTRIQEEDDTQPPPSQSNHSSSIANQDYRLSSKIKPSDHSSLPSLLNITQANELANKIDTAHTSDLINIFQLTDVFKGSSYKPRKHKDVLLQDISKILLKPPMDTNVTTSAPVLNIRVSLANNKVYPCILDTGTNVNIIQSKLVSGIKLNKTNLPNLVTANNEPLPILGSTNIALTIGDFTVYDKFLVSNHVTSPIIVGNQFFFKNKVRIDYSTEMIQFEIGSVIHQVPMDVQWRLSLTKIPSETEPHINHIIDITILEDIVIAPHQHIRVATFNDVSSDAIMETDNNFRANKRCHAYLSQSHDHQGVSVHIYNASNNTKRIKSNTVIGYIQDDLKSIRNLTSNQPSPNSKNSPSNAANETPRQTTPQLIPSSATAKRQITDTDGTPFNINPNLPVDKHNQLVALLEKYKDIFRSSTTILRRANIAPVKLELKPNSVPVSSPPYRQSTTERDELNKILDDLVKAGVLTDCGNFQEYASPAFLVKNSKGKPRLVTDFRKVNAQLKLDMQPLPTVDLVLSTLNKAKSYSQLDFSGAFHQIEIHPISRHLLAIRTQDRFLCYTRLPMGLSVSTAIFSRVIQGVLSKFLYKTAINYIDDIIQYNDCEEQEISNLHDILQEIQKANFQLNTAKCHFLMHSVDALGHRISPQGTKPLPSHTQAVLDFETPTTLRSLRQILGLSGFYRRYVKGYSQIVFPLTELVKKCNNGKENFKWTVECDAAFQTLKRVLTNPPLLSHWHDDRQGILHVDASLTGMGAALLQTHPENDQLHTIGYMSRKFSEVQMRYSSVEREFLALCFAVNYYRQFIYGRETIVYTDCSSLVFYKKFKHTTERLNRFAMTLVDYNLKVVYRKGAQHLLPDCLSRNPIDQELDETPLDNCFNIQDQPQINMPLLQNQDNYLRSIKLAKIQPDAVNSKTRSASRNYTEIEGILYYKAYDGHESKTLLAIPETLIPQIMKTFHDNQLLGAHFSYHKTYHKIKNLYHWPTMQSDILIYTKACPSCQKIKPKTYKNYGKLISQQITTKPWHRIVIDFLGKITRSNGYSYILVITDTSTRYAISIPCRNMEANTVAEKLLDVFTIFGFPEVITHDQASHFMNKVLTYLTKNLQITQRPSAAYCPQVQGLVERFNQTLIQCLMHYTEGNNWSKLIKPITFAYNITPHVSTGHSPFYLMFATNPKIPTDLSFLHHAPDQSIEERIRIIHRLRQEIPNILARAQNRQKYYFDLNKQDLNLKPGDEVLVHQHKDHTKPFSKFQKPFRGPFPVMEKLNDVTYSVQMYKNGKLTEIPIHVSRMKLFYKRLPEQDTHPDD